MTFVRVIAGFVRRRGAQSLNLVLLGVLAGSIITGLSTIQVAAETAIDDSVRADLGGRGFAVQTGNASAISTLSTMRDVAGLEDDNATVSNGRSSVPVSGRFIDDPSLSVGVVVSGRRPLMPGEVLLADAVASALGASPGDHVEVTRSDGTTLSSTVVGLSTNPVDRDSSATVVLVPEGAVDPTIWLSRTDPYAQAELQPLLDRRVAVYQTVDTLLDGAAQNRPQYLSVLRFMPAGAGLLLGVLLIAVGGFMSRRWVGYQESLCAAGMSRSSAWRTLIGSATALVVAGQIVGAFAAYLLISGARVPISGAVGQRWVTVPVPVLATLGTTAATGLLALSTLGALRVLANRRRRISLTRRTSSIVKSVGSTVFCLALIVWTASVWLVGDPDTDRLSALAAPIAVVLAASMPFALTVGLRTGLAPASRRVFEYLATSLSIVAALGAVVMVTGGIWTARSVYSATVGEQLSSPLAPPGAFVISELPDSAVTALRTAYTKLNGRELVSYQVPDEFRQLLRVTSVDLVECLEDSQTRDPDRLPDRCYPSRASAPINIVMLGPTGGSPMADPRLLEQGEDVGLLLFSADRVPAERVAVTAAAPDDTLGGNLPGLVVPRGGDVATEFGLVAGGTSSVALLDFADLSPEARFQVRSEVLRLAPGAQTFDGTDPTAYDRARSAANAVAFGAAGIAALIILIGSGSLAVSNAVVRRTIIDLAASQRSRRSLAARLMAVPLLSTAATAPLIYLTASYGARADAAPYGWVWVSPVLLGVATSWLAGWILSRSPAEVLE